MQRKKEREKERVRNKRERMENKSGIKRERETFTIQFYEKENKVKRMGRELTLLLLDYQLSTC